MKPLIILMTILISASVFAITLDFPADGQHLPTIFPNLNATNDLINANVTFYVNTSDGFGEEQEICNLLDTSDTEVNCTFHGIPHVKNINSIDFYFKMDEHLGNLTDSSGGGMDMGANIVASSGNFPIYRSQGGAINGYFDYNTTGTSYHQDPTPSVSLDDTDDFTYGMWIRIPTDQCVTGGSNFAGGMGQDSNTYTAFGRTASAFLNWNNVYISMDDAGCRSTGTVSIICNEWTFIVGRYDNSHSCQNFINGVQTCSGSCWDGNGFSPTTIWNVGDFLGGWDTHIDEAWVDKGTTWSDQDILDAYEMGEGVYYWKVNGTNTTTTDETDSRNFTLDITNPVIFLNLSDGETTDTEVSYLTNATDTNPMTLNISYQMSDINDTTGTSPLELIGLQSLQFGVNNFIATATDLAGNTAFAQAILLKTGWNVTSLKFHGNASIKNYGNQSWRIYA